MYTFFLPQPQHNLTIYTNTPKMLYLYFISQHFTHKPETCAINRNLVAFNSYFSSDKKKPEWPQLQSKQKQLLNFFLLKWIFWIFQFSRDAAGDAVRDTGCWRSRKSKGDFWAHSAPFTKVPSTHRHIKCPWNSRLTLGRILDTDFRNLPRGWPCPLEPGTLTDLNSCLICMFCLHFRFPFDHGLVSPPCEDGWFSVRPYFWGLFWRPYSLGSSKGKSLSFINLHRHELGKVCSQPGSFSKGQGVLQGKVKYRPGPNHIYVENECAILSVVWFLP